MATMPNRLFINVSTMDSLEVMALCAICARLVTDWDYSLGVHHLPTWIGPNGEAEAMSEREVRIIRSILAMA